MNQIKIELNKNKLTKLLIISSTACIAGFIIIIKPIWFTSGFISSTTVIRIFGVLVLLFFGLGLMYSLRKMKNKNLGLFIDNDGIIDTSSSFRFGLIDWQDIQNIRLDKSSKQPLILIESADYQKYLNRIESRVFRTAAEQNQKIYGSPLIIWCALLNTNPEELEILLNKELKEKK